MVGPKTLCWRRCASTEPSTEQSHTLHRKEKDIHGRRSQFERNSGLQGEAHGKPLCYLDTAATAQKPLAVIERMDHFLREEYGTVHRGLYQRSVQSTALYEQARGTVARFLGAQDDEIVFTMGTTDAINLVAWSWGRANLQAGDRVLVTGMEHHANIVPWQLVSEITGAELVPIPICDDGSLDLQAYAELLDERVKFVGIVHIANSLGTINPIKDMITQAHAVGAKVLADVAIRCPPSPGCTST